MPQKKTAKRPKMKKTIAKRQTQNGILALAEKVEKEFRQIPAKLSKLYRQELMAHKQQESKLKTDIKKANDLQKTAQKKQAVLMKAKPTKTTKKQLGTAKKSNDQAAKTIKTLTVKLDQLTTKSGKLLAKQNKYTALNKELAKLEKQLVTNAPMMTKAKAPKKATTQAKAKSTKPKQVKPTQQPTNENMSEETPFMISSKTEIVEV